MANNNQTSELTIFSILGLFIIGAFGIFWFAFSPFIGTFYRVIRQIESLFLWKYVSNWGQYFFEVRHGNGFLFKSIYLSSIPFNIISAIFIIIIGFIAYNINKNRHIDKHIKNDKPIGYKDLMKMQSSHYPANEFFLLFPMSDYHCDIGIAKLPITAIEFLNQTNAITGIYDELTDKKTGWMINNDIVINKLASVFGPQNPFITNEIKTSDPNTLHNAIDQMPWHLVSILYVCMSRIYAIEVYIDDDKLFAQSYIDADEYLKDIWREINKVKKNKNDEIVLGFDNDDDRKLKQAILNEKKENAKIISLKEALDTISENGKSVAENFKTTIKAREGIFKMLTEHLSTNGDTLTYFINKRGKQKKYKELSELEKEQFKLRRKKQIECIAYLQGLLVQNGYQFGILSTFLETTRKCGVLPPSQFRWMRFYDYHIYCYLRCLGMNNVTVEAAGMRDHYNSEKKIKKPILKPYISTSVEGIRIEASKYITAEDRLEIQTYKKQQIVLDKIINKITEAQKIDPLPI